MKKRYGKKFLDLVLYGMLRGLSAVVGALPRRVAFWSGESLGRLGRLTVGRSSRMARENLRRALPQLSDQELEQTHRAVFAHLGKVAIEMLRMGGCPREQLRPLFQIDGLDHLDAALHCQRGVLLVTGHVGFWEGGAWILPQMGYPIDFVAKTIKNPYLSNHLARLRQRSGGQLIDSRRGAGKIVRALARKRVVGVLLDQRTSRQEGVLVDFFGQPAYATPVISRIAIRYRVPVVTVFTYRTVDHTYRMVFEPMPPLGEDESPEAIVQVTAALTARIEAGIRRDVAQWCWDYDRWSPKAQASWEGAAGL